MPVPLIATTSLVYDGHEIPAGRRFAAQSQSDAQILKMLGKATEPPAPAVQPDELITVGGEADEADPPRRRARRRDLTIDPA